MRYLTNDAEGGENVFNAKLSGIKKFATFLEHGCHQQSNMVVGRAFYSFNAQVKVLKGI